MQDNKTAYSLDNVVNEYKSLSGLFKPEKSILSFLSENKIQGKMLDIGVGGGRTTLAFSTLFTEYIGVDYSKGMIDFCKKKYTLNSNCIFKVADARNLDCFKDNYFDFVLFSFNGIDCVSAEDRILIFKEINRILKPNAYFVFSFHNLYNVNELFSFQTPKNPFKFIKEYKRMKKVQQTNPPVDSLLSLDFASVVDGDINYSVSYIYSKPEFQIKQIELLGFTEIHAFSFKEGNMLSGDYKWNRNSEAWIHLICKK